ncbi:unnamed protein product [Ectocarpus sp. 12 AP-2014]
MSRKNPRDRGGTTSARKKSSSWSSDESGIVGNNARRWQRGRPNIKEGTQTRRPYSSPSLGSNDSGSSIETDIDRCSKQVRHQRDGNTAAAGHSTHAGEIRVVKSLQRKLLSDNGARLSRIERRLLRTDRKRKGVVSISTFEAALAAEKNTDDRAVVGRDEVRWLTRKLTGRNGKSVAILRMRALLESEEETGWKRRSSRKGQVDRHQYHRHRYHATLQCGRSSRGSERRRRSNGSTAGDGEEIGGETTSESTCSGRGDALLQRRSSPPPPARWAIRQGTVGQWLHEVAAPMERKLFFEFIKDLEKFELRNGLDHYRVRSSRKATRRNGSGDDDDGTTVLHLGPMLKASIKFYV